MSIRNMSGASSDTWHGQLFEQTRLQRPHADNEEGAEADREQDHPGSDSPDATGAARRGAAETNGHERAVTTACTSTRPVTISTTDSTKNPAQTDRPIPPRRRLPRRQRHQRHRHQDHRHRACPVERLRSGFVTQQQRRLDESDLQQAARSKTAATPARRCRAPAARRST